MTSTQATNSRFQLWTVSARLGVIVGLLVQFGSLAIHPIASFWPLSIAAGLLAFTLRLIGGIFRQENVRSLSARGGALLAAGVLSLVLQLSVEESATRGLVTGVRDGEYVLLNHGKISKRLSLEEYRRIFQTERAFMASVGVLISIAALVAGSGGSESDAEKE